MPDTKEPPVYVQPSIKPGWGFIPWWYQRRVHVAPTTFTPASNPTSDLGRAASTYSEFELTKTPVNPPADLVERFNLTVGLLSQIPSGRGGNVWESMGADSKTRGRLIRALNRGVTPNAIADAFARAAAEGLFMVVEYDGFPVWFALTYPQTVEEVVLGRDEVITYDLEEVLDRLEMNIGYAGNELAPGAAAAAKAAKVPSTYKNPTTFYLVEALGLRAGGGYDDVYGPMEPQEVLDQEARLRQRGPSGGDR